MSVPTGDFDEFYSHYAPFVRAYVLRRASSNDCADLVAEVFAIAWRRRDVVPANALPWLYRAARNVIGTRYRASARLRSLKEKLRDVPAETSGDPAEIAADRGRLFAAFADLSDDDRELLLLVAWEGLDNDDIAQVLGISTGACAVRLHRARNRLEAAIGGDISRGDSAPNDPQLIDITTATPPKKDDKS